MPKSPKWNELACPLCKEPVAVDAVRCPHCQTNFTSAQLESRRKMRRFQWLGCGGITLVALAVVASCVPDTPGQQVQGASLSSTSPPKVSAVAPAYAGAKIEEDAVFFYHRIIDAMAPCDSASTAFAETAGDLGTSDGNIFESYSKAAEVRDQCEVVWNRIKAFEVPENLPSKEGGEAIGLCADAAFAKRQVGDLYTEILDGDFRPSKVAEAQERVNASQQQTFTCVAGLYSFVTAAGVPIERLKNDGQ